MPCAEPAARDETNLQLAIVGPEGKQSSSRKAAKGETSFGSSVPSPFAAFFFCAEAWNGKQKDDYFVVLFLCMGL